MSMGQLTMHPRIRAKAFSQVSRALEGGLCHRQTSTVEYQHACIFGSSTNSSAPTALESTVNPRHWTACALRRRVGANVVWLHLECKGLDLWQRDVEPYAVTFVHLSDYETRHSYRHYHLIENARQAKSRAKPTPVYQWAQSVPCCLYLEFSSYDFAYLHH